MHWAQWRLCRCIICWQAAECNQQSTVQTVWHIPGRNYKSHCWNGAKSSSSMNYHELKVCKHNVSWSEEHEHPQGIRRRDNKPNWQFSTWEERCATMSEVSLSEHPYDELDIGQRNEALLAGDQLKRWMDIYSPVQTTQLHKCDQDHVPAFYLWRKPLSTLNRPGGVIGRFGTTVLKRCSRTTLHVNVLPQDRQWTIYRTSGHSIAPFRQRWTSWPWRQ